MPDHAHIVRRGEVRGNGENGNKSNRMTITSITIAIRLYMFNINRMGMRHHIVVKIHLYFIINNFLYK